MKNTKKFAAMIAALTLSACSIAPMAMTASADATENKITFTGEQAGTHSYSVYKIFAGNASANGMNTNAGAELNNLEWAINEDVQKALVVALQANDTLKTGETNDFATFSADTAPAVADFAAVVADFEANSAKAKAFAETVVKVFKANSVTAITGNSTDGVSVDEDGYYVIAETDVTMRDDDEYTGMTAYLLGVYYAKEGAEVTVKSSAPSFQKKLKDINDTTGEITSWQDSADYDIGDDVPFQLKATLPSTYADYKAYKLTFHDNFRDADGKEVFDFQQINKVYVDANNNGVFDDGETEITTSQYTLKQDATTQKESAVYNMEVEIANLKELYNGVSPETADVIVEYTAKLNNNAVLGSAGNWNDAYLSYTTNPNWNGEGDTNEEEKPKDSPVDTTVVFTYQTVINKVNPQGEALTGAEFTLQKEIKGTGGAENTWINIDQVKVEGATSTFTFKGLDDGNYKLTETKAPTNYKAATKPVFFTITADHTNDPETLALTSLTGAATTSTVEGFDDGFINLQTIANSSEKMSSEVSSGKIEANFINTSGAELPSTGGIGTKIFYLGGGAMVAVAGVFLITKKRMGKSEN